MPDQLQRFESPGVSVDEAFDRLESVLRATGQSGFATYIRQVRNSWPMSPIEYLTDLLKAWSDSSYTDGPIPRIEKFGKAAEATSAKLEVWRARASGQGELPL